MILESFYLMLLYIFGGVLSVGLYVGLPKIKKYSLKIKMNIILFGLYYVIFGIMSTLFLLMMYGILMSSNIIMEICENYMIINKHMEKLSVKQIKQIERMDKWYNIYIKYTMYMFNNKIMENILNNKMYDDMYDKLIEIYDNRIKNRLNKRIFDVYEWCKELIDELKCIYELNYVLNDYMNILNEFEQLKNNFGMLMEDEDISKLIEVIEKNENKIIYINIEDVYNNIMSISTNDIFKFVDLIFNDKNQRFKYLYNSYDIFIDQTLKNFLEKQEHIISTRDEDIYIYTNRFEYKNIMIEEPYNEYTSERIYPMDARQNNLKYQIKIYADVIQYQDKINTITQEKTTSKVGEMVEKTLICNMPLMVRSKRCSLNVDKSITKNECRFDPGGYFIIKGNEKVLINQDRRIDNKPIILTKKIGGVQLLVAEISSKTNDPSNISQIITLVMKNNGAITLNILILNERNRSNIY